MVAHRIRDQWNGLAAVLFAATTGWLGNNWSKPENLGPVVNSPSWESQPALSADGHTLYFASNRPGGQGNRDIWVTYLKGSEWSKPVNLGSKINTPYDDITPFIHANDQSLFFTSKGHPGLGGHDIYVSTREGVNWSEPVNIGYPINSYKDEVLIQLYSRTVAHSETVHYTVDDCPLHSE